jgi:hypothetical protein
MSTVSITMPPAIAGKFNIALTQSKFQQLADRANNLVYNEDNLEAIAEFLKDGRAVIKAISETHKEGKAEALKIGQEWDSAKRTFEGQVTSILDNPQIKYTKLCQEVELRKQKQEQERQRIVNIKNGIEANAVNFAKQIAECTTSVQLTNVERNINLEKTRKDKYMEFYDNAVERYSELNALLKTQKETVRELEDNARKQEEAKKANDDAELIRLQEEQSKQEAKIEEAKTVVQEVAINQSMKSEIPVAQEIIPEIKARRTTWRYEVVNEKEVMKKAPELVVFSIDEEKVKANLKLLKDSDQLEGKTELTINGIRYYEQKTF